MTEPAMEVKLSHRTPFQFIYLQLAMRKPRHESKPRRNGFRAVDIETFRNNQSRFPARKLKKYNGKYVAWCPDGTHIVASDKDPEKLCKKLVARGYKPGEVLVDTVVFPAKVGLGGASLFGENHT